MARQYPHIVLVFLEEPRSLLSCCWTFRQEVWDGIVHHVAAVARRDMVTVEHPLVVPECLVMGGTHLGKAPLLISVRDLGFLCEREVAVGGRDHRSNR